MAKILGGRRAGRGIRAAAGVAVMAVAAYIRIWASDTAGAPGATRIEALRAEIARHDELYFKKAAPEISDEAYDRLKRELTELERAQPATPGGKSETERIGDDRSERFAAARHGERMRSLEKVYSETELRTFLGAVERAIAGAADGGKSDTVASVWVIEPKYDGLAISATYERGRLVRVATRGNGAEGDDVTENARMIAMLPETLEGAEWPERIEVRGEVFVSFADFERTNAERALAGKTPFANPRALAAGSLKLADAREVRTRRLSVVFYGWGEVEPRSAAPQTQHDFHARVKRWGLPGVAVARTARTTDDVCDAVRALARERATWAFPTDGLVIKRDAVSEQALLGATDYAPRWAVAYKFSGQRAATRVREITLQVGRTGVLTPVAELEPVMLGGSMVARATLHNAAEIARLDVRVGDFVFVEKAGEIIPAVRGVDMTRREAGVKMYSFPHDCPECGAAVVTRDEDSRRKFCANLDCVGRTIARLRHFAGAQGVAIRDLGDETIAALVKARGVRNAADLYRLTPADWRALPGVGEKSAEALMASVEASKRAELWRFVSGLGVPGVGVTTSRILAGEFESLDGIAGADTRALAQIKGVGMRQAAGIAAFFAEENTRRLLSALRAQGVAPRKVRKTEDGAGALAGRVFVFTGELHTLTRAEAEDRVTAAGGVVRGSVSVKVDFVVAGANAGEKRRRAAELGVRVIGEETLLEMLDGVTDQ